MGKSEYKAKITIVGGCGHVGLPLGLVLAENNYRVTLLDIIPETVEKINRGIIPFQEEHAEELLKKHGGTLLTASTDPSELKDSSIVIFSLGTPVDEHHNPRITDLVNGIWNYIDYLTPDKLLVLRSTLFPGTSEYLVHKFTARFGSVKLAFCPERIVQGKGISEIRHLPQIISGNSEAALNEARALFGDISAGIVELSLKEAEIGKLFTNSWRYLEFAIANQFYMLAEANGLDFHRIFNAITAEYPRAASFARAGLAAGPCLFKDTMQLAAFNNNNFMLGHAAMMVNEGLPMYMIDQIEKDHDLSTMTVGLLGMAFKGESDDIRSSLSYKLKRLLKIKADRVLCSDPYVTVDPDLAPLDQVLEQADIIVIGAPHKPYAHLAPTVPVFDIWNVISTGARS